MKDIIISFKQLFFFNMEEHATYALNHPSTPPNTRDAYEYT